MQTYAYKPTGSPELIASIIVVLPIAIVLVVVAAPLIAAKLIYRRLHERTNTED